MTRITLLLFISFLLVTGEPASLEAAKKHTAPLAVKHNVAKKKNATPHAAKHSVAKKKLSKKTIASKKKTSRSAALAERSIVNRPRIEHEPLSIENTSITDADLSQELEEMRSEDNVKVNITDLFDESRNFSPKELLLGEEEANPAISRPDVMMTVVDWLGTPYHYGGMTRRGIDCSAFIQTIYRDALGVDIPRSSLMQFAEGTRVDQSRLEFGDLVFFQTRTRARVSHVGMYIGGGLFVHSGASSGVTISSLESAYFAKRFVGCRRIVTEQTQTASLK